MNQQARLKVSLGTAIGAGLAAVGVLASPVVSAADTPVTTIAGGTAACSVQIAIYPREAVATIMSGCLGGEYWLSSWVTSSDVYSSSFPQRLFGMANQAPWAVPLPTSPPCYFQVDFSKRSAPPGQHADSVQLIAAYLGKTQGCVTPTTTTSTTTTTLATGTTSTSTTSTTTTLVTTSTSTTSTTTATIGSAGATTSTTNLPLISGSIGGNQQPPAGIFSQPPSAVGSSTGPSSQGGLAFTGTTAAAGGLMAVMLLAFGFAAVEVSRIRRRTSGQR